MLSTTHWLWCRTTKYIEKCTILINHFDFYSEIVNFRPNLMLCCCLLIKPYILVVHMSTKIVYGINVNKCMTVLCIPGSIVDCRYIHKHITWHYKWYQVLLVTKEWVHDHWATKIVCPCPCILGSSWIHEKGKSYIFRKRLFVHLRYFFWPSKRSGDAWEAMFLWTINNLNILIKLVIAVEQRQLAFNYWLHNHESGNYGKE